jgi:hypothetical protein
MRPVQASAPRRGGEREKLDGVCVRQSEKRILSRFAERPIQRRQAERNILERLSARRKAGEHLMTAKEYLNQALRVDERINGKIEQIRSLRDLAEKTTSVLSQAPPSGTRNVSRLEDVIIKIIDMENELGADVERLLEIKRSVGAAIEAVENPTYRALLEFRYLCSKTWDDIAAAMNYNNNYLFQVHEKALKSVKIKKRDE